MTDDLPPPKGLDLCVSLATDDIMLFAHGNLSRARGAIANIDEQVRRLRYIGSGKEAAVPSIGVGEFHLFLSHVWGSGQDQVG